MHLVLLVSMRKALLFSLILLFLASFFIPHDIHAQSFLGGGTLQLDLTPSFPEPHSSVTVSLDDYSVETTGATITWYVNGIERIEDKNERSLTLQTGSVGEEIPIRVVLTRSNMSPLSSSVTIKPATVDVAIEADTYVPTFYAGRALPSEESLIRAVAVVHDGTQTADTSYSYKWSMGQTVFLGGAVRGKNVFEFTPQRYADAPLTVEVFDANGAQVAKKSIILTIVQPELHFYEQSPLRGLFEKEVHSPFTLIGDETTIFGEPYFFNASMDESDADFSWKINNDPTSHDSAAPNAITLRHVGGEGSAVVGLTITTKRQIPQFIENAFQLMFN